MTLFLDILAALFFAVTAPYWLYALATSRKYRIGWKERLGFARCRLSIAVPRDGIIETVDDLEGRTVATSYPNILGRFLGDGVGTMGQQLGVTADVDASHLVLHHG